ncbi:type II toxin-antitoxin system VapC family toxin [Candidatus Bathyarchaeota archaeon]|nr:type II toxin-antitoxin system VapC family toxin [Candidatus Bathyarchaeota archaeon]
MPETSFIDSNIFIYVMFKDPLYGDIALDILERLERGGEFGIVSTLILSQVFAHLARRKKWNAMDKFLEYIGEVPMRVVETTLEDFRRAGELGRRLKLNWRPWDDLIIASQMKRLKVKKIYSNDADFDAISDVERMFR